MVETLANAIHRARAQHFCAARVLTRPRVLFHEHNSVFWDVKCRSINRCNSPSRSIICCLSLVVYWGVHVSWLKKTKKKKSANFSLPHFAFHYFDLLQQFH